MVLQPVTEAARAMTSQLATIFEKPVPMHYRSRKQKVIPAHLVVVRYNLILCQYSKIVNHFGAFVLITD